MTTVTDRVISSLLHLFFRCPRYNNSLPFLIYSYYLIYSEWIMLHKYLPMLPHIYSCPLYNADFFFLGSHLQHLQVPRLMVELELQLPAYVTDIAIQESHTTDTATWDPSSLRDLHHSSWQYQILNPLNEARDRAHTLMDPSWVC